MARMPDSEEQTAVRHEEKRDAKLRKLAQMHIAALRKSQSWLIHHNWLELNAQFR